MRTRACLVMRRSLGFGTGAFKLPDFLKFEVQFMQYILTISLVLFLIAWSIFGVWLVIKYGMLFGPHPDDPAETAGARSFGVAHVAAVWVGVFALATYFLFR